MMKTPKSHLPKGYPLPPKAEQEKFNPIWKRAFEIHNAAHDFDSNVIVEVKGAKVEYAPRRGIINPIMGRSKLSKSHYCDCYERAYQEAQASND